MREDDCWSFFLFQCLEDMEEDIEVCVLLPRKEEVEMKVGGQG